MIRRARKEQSLLFGLFQAFDYIGADQKNIFFLHAWATSSELPSNKSTMLCIAMKPDINNNILVTHSTLLLLLCVTQVLSIHTRCKLDKTSWTYGIISCLFSFESEIRFFWSDPFFFFLIRSGFPGFLLYLDPVNLNSDQTFLPF